MPELTIYRSTIIGGGYGPRSAAQRQRLRELQQRPSELLPTPDYYIRLWRAAASAATRPRPIPRIAASAPVVASAPIAASKPVETTDSDKPRYSFGLPPTDRYTPSYAFGLSQEVLDEAWRRRIAKDAEDDDWDSGGREHDREMCKCKPKRRRDRTLER